MLLNKNIEAHNGGDFFSYDYMWASPWRNGLVIEDSKVRILKGAPVFGQLVLK